MCFWIIKYCGAELFVLVSPSVNCVFRKETRDDMTGWKACSEQQLVEMCQVCFSFLFWGGQVKSIHLGITRIYLYFSLLVKRWL